MELSRVTLIPLMYVWLFRMSGAELEMRVTPGDDVTLYGDCVWKVGFNVVWFRNSSNETQPPLVISAEDLVREDHPRYSFVWNPCKQAHDLLVKAVSESDLGLYYCALHEKKITEDETGGGVRKDVYYYGNRTTRLALLGEIARSDRPVLVTSVPDTTVPETTPTSPVSDCSISWKLLLSVCPVCVLLSSVISSTCVYSICRNRTEGVVSFSPQRTSGAEVDMTVRRQDNVTIYSDCVWRSGYYIAWFRNSSHEHHSKYTENLMLGAHPRYKSVWNPSNRTYDLLVRNVSESDLGLYYCAVQDKITREDAGVMVYEDVYHYGNRTTRLSLLSKSSVFWFLRVLFGYVLFNVGGWDVCYASLDLPSRGQTCLKKKRVESSEFSTYSEQSCVKHVYLVVPHKKKATQRDAITHDSYFPLTWTNQSSAQTSASKTPSIFRFPGSVSEMERSRVVLLALMCVTFVMTSGEEVEIRVRPGDDVTLYCDCVWEQGFNIAWFRNCSHKHQPPLVISSFDLMESFNLMPGAPVSYKPVWNPTNITHDLLVGNVSESDLGLYYCALQERRITKDTTGVTVSRDVYHYGNRTSRLSLLETTPQTSSTPPVSDCSVCWKLLVSVSPVCALLSSILSSTCVYCICRNRFTGTPSLRLSFNSSCFVLVPPTTDQMTSREKPVKPRLEEMRYGKHDNTNSYTVLLRISKSQAAVNSPQVGGHDVCYASLDLPSRGETRPRTTKKRVECSEFSTYSEVKTGRT
ncbi:hypothetical protein NFI96_025321 [Prochilodus magdalenae]|nr:hypothetical protein NFI96_025321 [Prochilodus magdalenae]